MVLAKHYSRKAVIEAYRAAGVRLQWLSHAEITRQAMAYLEAHPIRDDRQGDGDYRSVAKASAAL
jgi:hypothetical protein